MEQGQHRGSCGCLKPLRRTQEKPRSRRSTRSASAERCPHGDDGWGEFVAAADPATSDIDRAAAGYSPDRVDALVWAFSELLVERMKGEGIYELYRQQAEAAEQRRKPQPVQIVPQPGSMEWFELQKRKAEQSGGTV